MALTPGRCVLVKYPNQPRLWHERLILTVIGDGRHYTVTPDSELFPMTLTCPPLLDMRMLDADRSLPDDIAQGNTYMIGEDTADGYFSRSQLEEFQATAERLTREERREAGITADVEATPAGDSCWVYSEALGGRHVGERVDGDAGPGRLPRTALVNPAGTVGLIESQGEWVKVEKVADLSRLEEWASERAAVLRGMRTRGSGGYEDEDIRTIAVRYGLDGERHLPFNEAVSKMFESEMDDFELSGPRTTMWWLRAVARTGSAPIARHYRWVREAEIPGGDRSIYEHEVYSRALEAGACYDGLNLPNLALAEIMVRRLQLIEEAHVDSPSAPSYEGAEHFAGHGEKKGGALIAPKLQEHVASKMREEAAILKERRKVREARTLGKGGGGGGGRGANSSSAPGGS